MCISSLLIRNHIQKSSPMSMEVKLPAILGNYDRPTATDRRTKRQGHREVSFTSNVKPIYSGYSFCAYCTFIHNANVDLQD